MSNLAVQTMSAIEAALVTGDLSKLSTEQRVSYYNQLCASLGLNALTKPFDYIQLNGKLTLYAKRDATDQLRKVHGVSIRITAREKIEDIYIVTAQGSDRTGRCDESTGAVNVKGLTGENLANAFLKAETKAKRRVTLSLCGLGLLDETEVSTISDAKPFAEPSLAQANVSSIKEVMKEAQWEAPSEVVVEEKVKNPIFEIVKEEKSAADFMISFGKFKGQTIGSADPQALSSYCEWLYNSAKNSGKPMGQSQIDMLEAANLFLSELDGPPKLDDEPLNY